jgi:hypothetical protein
MQTTLFKVTFNDGRIYNINCIGSNQIKRFRIHVGKLKEQITKVEETEKGIHNIKDFETI